MFESSTAAIVLSVLAIPGGLLVGVGLLGWLYRRDVERAMRRAEAGAGGAHAEAPADRGCDGPSLRRQSLEGRPLLEPGVPPVIADARDTTRRMHRAHAAAAFAYGLILSGGLLCFWRQAPLDARVATAGCLWLPQLAMLAWFLRMPFRRQLVLMAAYVLAVVLLMVGLSGPQRAGRLAGGLAPWFAVLPFLGGWMLVTRRLRPFIAFLAALVLFLVVGATFAVIAARAMGVDPSDLRAVRTWVVAIGFFNVAAGVAVFGWLLRRRSWRAPVMALLVTAGAAAHELWGPFDLASAIFFGVAANVVQVFLVWLTLKGLLLLGERHLLPGEILHAHLCWGLLTLYLLAWSAGRALWGDPRWLQATVLLAFTGHLVILHVLVRRVWGSRAGRPGLRLLLLRVFGHGGTRERLMERLDDTWRRVGRIDLLSGTDLAVPAMSAAMLEAFLLRRVEVEFLRTPEAVDRRLSQLRSSLEGDARYPVNSVSCHANVWRDAFGRLATGVDAVIVDARGLTRRNEGSLLELAYLVQRVALDRIMLLVDSTTDLRALDEATLAAWGALPADSPNALDPDPSLRTVWLAGTRDDQDLLFEVLLNAALPALPVSGGGARCGPPGPG